ncbi:MAG: purine-nucleoside phosphorylase, partial [Candidatus Eisenbacteria bacterium]|nr:purine-nucleoside phosphorylase [Candidatus Latescibacterota bacterium]MBD3301915.1 purine-nucleoside phosphorylase [Candidatus Eisenbacteria bacterium]
MAGGGASRAGPGARSPGGAERGALRDLGGGGRRSSPRGSLKSGPEMTEGPQKPRIDEAVAFLHRATSVRPTVGVVLGTGLGTVPDAMEVDRVVPFAEVPHFPTSAVESHANELVFGTLSGRSVVLMRGRVHYYEGFSMREVTFPIRVLRGLGVEILLLTSAVGGMNPLLELSQIVRVDDHINLMGDNPLIGPNEEELGPRFPDMSEPYDKELQKRLEEVALREGIPLRPGILVGVAGPNLETRAEYRFLRWCGADVVGMSMIPENLVAVHGGMR